LLLIGIISPNELQLEDFYLFIFNGGDGNDGDDEGTG
jgi:hypothetical protein